MSIKFETIFSYIYRHKALKILNTMRTIYSFIDHFAINVVLDDGRVVNYSTSTEYMLDYAKHHINELDGGLDSTVLNQHIIIPWRAAPANNNQLKALAFKEKKHSLLSGISFSRKLDDIIIIYAVATKNDEPCHLECMSGLHQQIMEAGDMYYDLFKPMFQEHLKVPLPALTSFNIASDIIDTDYQVIEKLMRLNNRAGVRFY